MTNSVADILYSVPQSGNNATYGPLYSYEGCANTTVTGGPYNAGATSLTVANASLLASGATAWITCSDASQFSSVFTVSGSTVTLSTPVPSGKSVSTGGAFKVAVSEIHGDGFQFGNVAAPTVISGNHIDVRTRVWDRLGSCPVSANANTAAMYLAA